MLPPPTVVTDTMQTELDGLSRVDRCLRESRPAGLWNLALTELWERFSFYGLQGILTFYLLYTTSDGGLELTPVVAVGVVGAYGGGVYLAQLPGAWLADRVIAPRYLVLVGGIVITFGHVVLAIVPGVTGLVLGLAAIAVGTGGLKTSITSIVGLLYNDRPREERDSGFSYFYMAISIGSVAGPLLVGFTQSRWGFHVGFGLAAVGMMAALAQYATSMQSLPPETAVVKNPISRAGLARSVALVLLALAAIGVGFASGAVTGTNIDYVVGCIIVVVFIVYIAVMLRSDAATPLEKRRVRGFVPMWCASALYFGYAGQVFTTLPLIVTQRVNLEVNGWRIPDAWLGLVGGVVVIACIPIVASVLKTTAIGRANATTKYIIGFVIMGCAWLSMLLIELFPGKTVPPALIGSCLAIAGFSEIFIGPICLSLASHIAPRRFISQVVALQILAIGAGATIYGCMGALFTTIPSAAFFVIIGVLALAIAVVLKVFSQRIETLLASA